MDGTMLSTWMLHAPTKGLVFADALPTKIKDIRTEYNKLLGTSASLLVTSALLVVTRSY